MPKIVIMAGGTGGHIYPGLAVAEVLQKEGWQIDWIGTKERMEAQIVPKHNLPIHFLHVRGIRGKGILRKLALPFALFSAVISARRLFKQLRPDVVLGMGGYASGPGGIGAFTLGIPLVIHEQNAVFGLTNRVLAKFATAIFTGFDCETIGLSSKAPQRTRWVGNPVREAFFAPTKAHQSESVKVLITGGSLGAEALNELVPSIINELKGHSQIEVTHQCGNDKQASVSKYDSEIKSQVVEFIENSVDAFKWADIIICRAGALTVAEVAAVGKPAIFIPLPIAVDDHQTANARALSDIGAAFTIQQRDLSMQLPKKLQLLLVDDELRRKMGHRATGYAKPKAANDIAQYCLRFSSKEKQI